MRDRSGHSATTQLRQHLAQVDLAERWKVSGRTLEKWRQKRRGPPYLLIGGAVRYRLEDVIAFETANLRGGR